MMKIRPHPNPLPEGEGTSGFLPSPFTPSGAPKGVGEGLGVRAIYEGGITILAKMRASSPTFTPVPFTQITIEDSFWSPKLRVNRERTIPHIYQQCLETGRIDACNTLEAGAQ